MKTKTFLVGLFLILCSYAVYAECGGCVSSACSNDCCAFGDIGIVGSISSYCDLNSGAMIPQKTEGFCDNNFECSQNYTCLGNNCTNIFNSYISNQSLLLELENIATFCMGEGYFCSSSATAPLNSTLQDKNCSYLSNSYNCYKCNSGFSWNETIGKCIPPVCTQSPGCINMSSLGNASEVLGYCSTSGFTCFACSSNYDWNSSSNSCKLKSCNSLPGCLNKTSLDGASNVNRACDNGYTCFECSSGYGWDGSSCTYIEEDNDNSNDNSLEWTTIPLSSSQFNDGLSIDLGVYQRVYVSVEGQSHWIGVMTIAGVAVSLSVNSNPQTVILSVGETKNIEITEDNYYDLSIKLNSVSSNKANLIIQSIHEVMNVPVVRDQTNPPVITPGGTNSLAQGTKENSSVILYVVLGFLSLLVIIVVILIIYSASNKPQATGGSDN